MRKNPIDDKIKEKLEKLTKEERDEVRSFIVMLEEMKYQNKVVDSQKLKRMFNLYNHYFDATENAIYCSTCRATCFRGVVYVKKMIDENA